LFLGLHDGDELGCELPIDPDPDPTDFLSGLVKAAGSGADVAVDLRDADTAGLCQGVAGVVWWGLRGHIIERCGVIFSAKKSAVRLQAATAHDLLGEDLCEHLGFVDPVLCGNPAEFDLQTRLETGADSDSACPNPLQVAWHFWFIGFPHDGILRHNIMGSTPHLIFFIAP
jgi:hypothetical protein